MGVIQRRCCRFCFGRAAKETKVESHLLNSPDYQRPCRMSSARSSSRRSAFICSNHAVTRPEGDRPRIVASANSKWSSQRSRRGLNNGTSSLVSGSTPERLVPLWRLQRQQAQARFEGRRLRDAGERRYVQRERDRPIRFFRAIGSIRSGPSPAPVPVGGSPEKSRGICFSQLAARFELKGGNNITDFNQRIVFPTLFRGECSGAGLVAQDLHPLTREFVLSQFGHCPGSV